MAHFAELDSNNIVLRVVVISNDDIEANGGDYSSSAETFVSNLVPHSDNGVAWKQTSFNNKSRKQYAGIGYTYNSTKNKFLCPQPYTSWSLNGNDDWEAPVTYPTVVEMGDNPIVIEWDEDNQKWIGNTWTGENFDTRTNYEWDSTELTWTEV